MWIRLSNTDVLPLKEEDVHRVYELPMAGEQINPKLCSEAAIRRLRAELGLDANNAAIANVKELEKRMDIIENPTAWVKGAICLIIHNILCPTNRSSVYLHYAEVLENASTYNWCSYVLHYMKDGLQNPKVANPLADFHFLMINYMEKMGKKSPFLTGIYKRPSLRDWDVKMANQDLQKVQELMGLDNGLTYGVKRLHSTADGPLVMCFDADTCPLSKAEEHLNYCRGAIRVYTTAAETLQRRIAEGSVGTSREDDPVQIQSKKTEENERSNNEKEKAEKDSSIPQISTQEEESEGANLDNDNVAEDDINAKSVDKDDDDNEDDEADETNAKGIDEDEDDKADEINAQGIDEDDNASKIIDDSVKTSSNVQDEVNAKVVDDSMKQPSNVNEEMFNAEDDNAERIDEDDDEEEIIAKMIDDSVKAACKVIDDSIKTSSNVQDEMNAKFADDSTKQPSNEELTFTQETILKFPEYLGDVNEEINTNDSETAGPATQETMLKFPQYFDNDSTKEKCSQSLALVFVPEAKGGEKPTECNEEIVLDATPLRTALPDEIIDLDNVTTKKRKKHTMLYSDSTYQERRRAVKKSKYLESPYDDVVHEFTSSELEKQLSTYAWSPELDPHDVLYCSKNKSHQYALERQALWSLQQDEWVSCLVINVWVNCLNWNQPRDKMNRLVTPMINYVDLERPGAFDNNNPAAFARFIDRLSKFKYINWKDMDPNSLELIMTPTIIGNPISHYVCFVVNLKRQKYEFLNSLTGDTLYNKNGTATGYKDMFDVWLNEVQVFVAELYRRRNICMPYKFNAFEWDSPKVPDQVDKDNCGIFCMRFLAEWVGDNTQLDSFKGWSKMKKVKKMKVAKMMELRIGICSTILNDTSNCMRNVVLNEAKKHHEKKLQKLAK
ncbi:1-aminocyclopropane-1-carboxylate synthase [Trifolium repens]|nr:1-aminocyclopropane-1-carboxylate synthase [Trifolium repens]